MRATRKMSGCGQVTENNPCGDTVDELSIARKLTDLKKTHLGCNLSGCIWDFLVTKKKHLWFNCFAFSLCNLQVVDTSGLPLARRAPSVARLGGRPPLRSCNDCRCWAPWPWQTGGWDPRGSQRRPSCRSGCQTVTGWRRKAPPKEKKNQRLETQG